MTMQTSITGVRYRNLAVITSRDVPQMPSPLTPPAGVSLSASTDMLFRMNMLANELSDEWWCSQPESVRFEDRNLILNGPNGSPECTLWQPLKGDFAANLRLERTGPRIRLFVDSGLLLEAIIQDGKMPDRGNVYFGMSQFYGGSKIHGLSLESIPAQ